jgi:beta-glucosidase
MTQPEIAAITPDEVKQYAIGSVLNGGGSWPGKDKHATQASWLAAADAYWDASKQTAVEDPGDLGHRRGARQQQRVRRDRLPAQHRPRRGAGPVPRARHRPRDRRQVRATGQDWDVRADPRRGPDDRWGRTYEGFSEDPRIVRAYGYEAINGLQDGATRASADGVIATAKHYIGDGGTIKGQDQGVNPSSEAELINVHGQGYYGALARRRADRDGLVQQLDQRPTLGSTRARCTAATRPEPDAQGQDGLRRPRRLRLERHRPGAGCTNASCPQAINAGIDVIMVPERLEGVHHQHRRAGRGGQIPMSRIDDAVTRILRVKLRAGLFEAPQARPARSYAGSTRR